MSLCICGKELEGRRVYCSKTCQHRAQNKRKKYKKLLLLEGASSGYKKAREFIEAWYSSESLDEVAKKVGFKSRQAVSQRANYLRKKGIVLTPYKRKKSGLDKTELEQLKALSRDLERRRDAD